MKLIAIFYEKDDILVRELNKDEIIPIEDNNILHIVMIYEKFRALRDNDLKFNCALHNDWCAEQLLKDYGREVFTELDNYETVMKDAKDELIPLFFEGLEIMGNSSFDGSRIRKYLEQLNIDESNDFERELFEQLSESFNCEINYTQYDSYIIVHNDFRVTENGDCIKNIQEQPINEDKQIDELFENRTYQSTDGLSDIRPD